MTMNFRRAMLTTMLMTLLLYVESNSRQCQCIDIQKCDMATVDYRPSKFGKDSKKSCDEENEICCYIPMTMEITNGSISENSNLSCGQVHTFAPRHIPEELTGFSANYGEQPWIVQLITTNHGFWGAGSLIHPKAVVSSAEKRKGYLIIKAGVWNSSEEYDGYHQIRTVDFVVRHPGFQKLSNNVAIYFVQTPFVLTLKVNLICIPNSIFDLDTNKCVAAGWGLPIDKDESGISEILKKIPMSLMSRDLCNSPKPPYPFEKNFNMADGEICAINKIKEDICNGDAGGPLACPYSGSSRMALLGTISYGFKCSLNLPNYFVDVVFHREWIKLVLKENL